MRTIKVWDLFVRIFHWSLVAAIIAQLLTAEDFTRLHAVVGYGIVALLTLRILWGFIGTRHARFTDFIYPPAAIFAYLKGLPRGASGRFIGHNPAGGVMVVALLTVLALTTGTGLLTYGAQGRGPLASGALGLLTPARADGGQHQTGDQRENDDPANRRDHAGSGAEAHFWKEIHETLVGLLLFLAALHVAGVVASSYAHKENLIWAMITGRKRSE
jgi:cytochrome b